jgi:hypothetical protein
MYKANNNVKQFKRLHKCGKEHHKAKKIKTEALCALKIWMFIYKAIKQKLIKQLAKQIHLAIV